jgi:hypothetical protein
MNAAAGWRHGSFYGEPRGGNGGSYMIEFRPRGLRAVIRQLEQRADSKR